jgi:GNAT superfamily N-acetyltransferase
VTGELTLRAPGEGDVDAMFELVAACDETWRDWTPAGWEPPDPASARWVAELSASDRWSRLAVEPDGRIVGLVSWGPAREGAAFRTVPGVAHVGALFVHPDRWRRGIARLLLDAALDAMRSQGYRRATLNTPAGAPAERFYVAQGWHREGPVQFHRVVRLPSVGYGIDL